MGKKIFILLNLVLTLCVSSVALSQENSKFLSIHELKNHLFRSGTFTTEGFVVKIYTCPSCPKNAQCKPCMRDNIVVSEDNKNLISYTLSEKDLIVFVKNSKLFKVGKKYRFLIKVNEYSSTNERVNDAELINYRLIK